MLVSRHRHLIISYLAMRRLIGVLGIALPIVVVAGGFIQNELGIQGSVSAYYYSQMRDVYVGILSGVALFLISYKGYETIDNVIGNMSGLCALGIVFFPTAMYSGKVVRVGLFLLNDSVSEYVHLGFGALFFLSLSFNSLFLFTKHDPGRLGKRKMHRNMIYRTCGVVILLAIVCITIYTAFLRNTPLASTHPVLICESIALFAFGISWVVKGNTLFRD